MGVINYKKRMDRDKLIIENVINRNDTIREEVKELSSELNLSKEIILDNLIFDYLTLEEEMEFLKFTCDILKVDYSGVRVLTKILSDNILLKDFTKDEVFNMTQKERNENILRVNKRLILSNIKEEYASLMHFLTTRARFDVRVIVGGCL